MTAVDTLERFDATVRAARRRAEPDGSPAEIEGVLNPASAVTRDGTLLLYPRAVAAGNISRVELCRGIRDGGDVRFDRLGFALEPSAPYEVRTVPGGMGCEDPRVTFVPVLDRYLMAYTAFGTTDRASPSALAGRLSVGAPGAGVVRADLPQGDDKDGVFFPEPVLSPTAFVRWRSIIGRCCGSRRWTGRRGPDAARARTVRA